MSVKCSCGAVTTMMLVKNDLFHLGSVKDSMVKHYLDTKHEPICLWCGREFEPIESALSKLRAGKVGEP